MRTLLLFTLCILQLCKCIINIPLYDIFYTKIINTPIFSNTLLKYHHIVLLQKTPFSKNQTTYKNIYIIDFIPCGNLFEIIMGKKIKGDIRVIYINECNSSNIYETLLSKKKENKIYEIKHIDTKLYNKIKTWDLSFNLYNRNCQHFSKYLSS
jgi:hypothetical protein